MENHKRDLKLMAESIIRELEYNSIHNYETKKDIEMIIGGILPTLLRNCHELNIMERVRHMIKIVEEDK
jgi:hypothetical protein